MLLCCGSWISVSAFIPSSSSADGRITGGRWSSSSTQSEQPACWQSALWLSREQSEEDVERYRNRATLTQSILKEKVDEVKLLKNKILLMQDVVTRLKTESKRELGRKLGDQEVKHGGVLEALQSALESTKSLLEVQTQQHAQVVKDLQADISKQEYASAQNDEQESRAKKKIDNQIKALQKEVLDMDEDFETTQGELQKVQRRLVAREDEIRSKEVSAERKRKSLEKKVKELEAEQQSALSDSTSAEELRQESLEIANASVQAAAKREELLKRELDDLKESVTTLKEENEQLESGLESGNGDQSSNRDQNSNKSQISTRLNDKIARLQEKLQEQRLASDISRKVEQERFDTTLQAERTKHEEDLQRLRTRLQKKDEPIGTRSNNNNVSNNVNNNGKTKGGLKGILRRILS
eukprot:CAMPEP_0119025376 /NCGR_PEP_ID=MMETSP1176-20130426/33634_1 /TAXON_ID=265551 /ORGANISM="Synedropsis recta cf, Strain CCMP1620" /LENGTH=410 /DNA_ID=CAMNT_0006980907 /DNA_START=1 /DNA_END=1233 /DNA_ORIENTATION=-